MEKKDFICPHCKPDDCGWKPYCKIQRRKDATVKEIILGEK